jgi:hypothetical protein
MTDFGFLLEAAAARADDALEIVTATVALASAICALTPTPRDDAAVARLYRLLEILALNVGHAKDGASRRR